jgi:hypothetical protein
MEKVIYQAYPHFYKRMMEFVKENETVKSCDICFVGDSLTEMMDVNNFANKHCVNRGIVSDKLSTYRLDGYDIILNVSSETLYDAEEMEDSPEGDIGYILGSYSRNGKQIMITHIIDSLNAKDVLSDAFKTSKGLIDYIGDYIYSSEEPETYNSNSFEIIASKADDLSINTNNNSGVIVKRVFVQELNNVLARIF